MKDNELPTSDYTNLEGKKVSIPLMPIRWKVAYTSESKGRFFKKFVSKESKYLEFYFDGKWQRVPSEVEFLNLKESN